jgi:hypothetical protein
MPANSDISAWVPPYTPPLTVPHASTVPLAMYRDMVDRWGEAQAQVAGLRALLYAHGIPTDDRPGDMTLRRVRDFERVRYLAREYAHLPTDDLRRELLAAIAESEVTP